MTIFYLFGLLANWWAFSWWWILLLILIDFGFATQNRYK